MPPPRSRANSRSAPGSGAAGQAPKLMLPSKIPRKLEERPGFRGGGTSAETDVALKIPRKLEERPGFPGGRDKRRN
jgi:hypothetical protein